MKISRALLGLLCLVGCNLPPELPRFYFYGDDTAICLGARPTSFTTDLVFEVDVVLLSGYSRDYTLEGLLAQDISFSGPGQYAVESIQEVASVARQTGPTAILIDQSGSYEQVDSSNFRSKQLNQFIHELPNPGQFLLGGFASNGFLSDAPVEFCSPAFTTGADGCMDFLFGLSKRTGGQSVLYDAMTATVNKFSGGGDRSLLIVAHETDAASTLTQNDAVSAATGQSVKTDVIFLGDSTGAMTLVPLSMQTGGLFVACASDRNMITALNLLNTVYYGDPFIFRVTVRYTPALPLVAGQETYHRMIIYDSVNDINLNMIPVYIKVP